MRILFLSILCLFIVTFSTERGDGKSRASTNDTLSYPQNYFRSPLDLPLTLAGNFGEPRTGHFHTGLDFHTGQEEGHPVFAAADGYVSRIDVSPVGYGNALYITHPNGYVTVYGHLREFTPQLMERLRKEQYAKKSFAVDIIPGPRDFPVKQGELIAHSGSTGSSGGPHLHFEIRDASEHPINPLLFGFGVKDEIAPVVGQLKLYPLDTLKYDCDGYLVKLSGKNRIYEPTTPMIKVNSEVVGVSVNTWDVMSKGGNRLGIYELKMFVDEKLVYRYKINKIAFTDTRYVLSQVDYPLFIEDGDNFNRCYVEPGNKCPAYSDLDHKGIIHLSDRKTHDVKIESGDFSGNVSTIQFKLKYDPASVVFKGKESKCETRFDYNKENHFANGDVELKIPAGCLFDTTWFSYSAAFPTEKGIYSKIHHLGDIKTGCFTWYQLAIKTEKLNPNLREKALIVFKDEKGTEFSRGGRFENGFIVTKAREFGTCYIKVDTVPPTIVPVGIINASSLHKTGKIIFKINDDLSGINSYNAYLDGIWVLAEYDAKSSSLTHTLDPLLKSGEHIFKIVIEDERHNSSEYTLKFKL